jgi:hypothetical protein
MMAVRLPPTGAVTAILLDGVGRPLARTLGAIRRPVILNLGSGRFQIRWRGLGTGLHRLTVGLREVQSPPFEIDSIAVDTGKTTDDPRLRGIDLRRR